MLRVATADADAVGDGDADPVSVGDGEGDSCANPTLANKQPAQIGNRQLAIGNLNIVPPVQVGEKIVAPFAIGEEFFIERARDKLIM